MDHPRPCGCKGRRTCLKCEKEFCIERKDFLAQFQSCKSYVFCPSCNKIYPGWHVDKVLEEHFTGHNDEIGDEYPGIYIDLNFLSIEEEGKLLKGIDEMPWDNSQSGRRKQNFGPKANFKKQKLKLGEFGGFPKFSQFVQQKFEEIPILNDFQTIEQCSLEYTPERGASIDPHIDDCWIWGERIVTVNLLCDSVLTMSRYKQNEENIRYNLQDVDKYRKTLMCNLMDNETLENFNDKIVRIPMPRRSLLILYGPPRFQWEHCVLREDIQERRVCIAYREFTPMYVKGGCEYSKSENIYQTARQFWNHQKIPNDMNCGRTKRWYSS